MNNLSITYCNCGIIPCPSAGVEGVIGVIGPEGFGVDGYIEPMGLGGGGMEPGGPADEAPYGVGS